MSLILFKLFIQSPQITSLSEQRHPDNPAYDTRGCKRYQCFIKALWPMPVKIAPPHLSRKVIVFLCPLLDYWGICTRWPTEEVVGLSWRATGQCGISSISEAKQGQAWLLFEWETQGSVLNGMPARERCGSHQELHEHAKEEGGLK